MLLELLEVISNHIDLQLTTFYCKTILRATKKVALEHATVDEEQKGCPEHYGRSERPLGPGPTATKCRRLLHLLAGNKDGSDRKVHQKCILVDKFVALLKFC